jgi:hypothetical protein
VSCRREPTENIGDSDPHAADARPPAELPGFNRDDVLVAHGWLHSVLMNHGIGSGSSGRSRGDSQGVRRKGVEGGSPNAQPDCEGGGKQETRSQ